jgi:UDP-N-acetyl-2-amino-2-deoxyglucuronate dehydrogenase
MTGNGFGLNEAKTSINIVQEIRRKQPKGQIGNFHPFAKLPLGKHPFQV